MTNRTAYGVAFLLCLLVTCYVDAIVINNCHSMKIGGNPHHIVSGDRNFVSSTACVHEYHVWYWALRDKAIDDTGVLKEADCNWFASYGCIHACLIGCMKGHIPSVPGLGCRRDKCLRGRPYWTYKCDCGTHPITNQRCVADATFEQAHGFSSVCAAYNRANPGKLWSQVIPSHVPIGRGRYFWGVRSSLNDGDFPSLADGMPCPGLQKQLCASGEVCVWAKKVCKNAAYGFVQPEHCQQFKCVKSQKMLQNACTKLKITNGNVVTGSTTDNDEVMKMVLYCTDGYELSLQNKGHRTTFVDVKCRIDGTGNSTEFQFRKPDEETWSQKWSQDVPKCEK